MNEVERLEAAYDEALRAYEKAQDAANDALVALDRAYDVWQKARDVGKSLGCCDCDSEFVDTSEQDAHAAHTGHNVVG